MFTAKIGGLSELRMLEERHAPVVFALVDRDREDLRRWLPWVDATESEDDTSAFIRGALDRFTSKGEIAAGIWHQERYAGGIGMHRIDRQSQAVEIGYWLGREFRGKGIITEACRAVLRHAFAELQLNRVEIRCATGNARSRAIPERLGFTHEGTLREAQCLQGTFHNLELYSMLRSEFVGRVGNS